ncbi:MAG TPA: protein kinase [Polyangiaceae bacterium]|nr:protein kinase [Polyangiaceae bacterium]
MNTVSQEDAAFGRVVGPGDVLGRYELLLPVAAGGMAMVWAARLKGSRGFQKIVAVKTMLPKLSEDPQFERMFLDEASLASRIHHPNVVEVLDLGEANGVLFIAMEWLDGVPLNQVMKAAKGASGIPSGVAIHILTDAAEGLHAAHELKDDNNSYIGLVHRDVSPQNILVGHDGLTKMVDFGLAKATALGDGATRAGQLKGKISYMAPEQIRGDPLDRRADVFALGVVLYAVTTGKHPFRRESEGATLFAISAPDPAPAPSRFMTYPPELEAVLMKAVAKDPDKRYGSSLEFARALEGTLPDAERAHGGERVAEFIKGLLGAQHEQQKAALAEALRRADRASMQPTASALEGLTGSGSSSISSLSAVGISRPSQDGISGVPFENQSSLRRARLPLALVGLALVVGGAAYAITRSTTKPEANTASPGTASVTAPVEPPTPEVKLGALPVEPAASPDPQPTDAPPADSATADPTTGRTPRVPPHGATLAPAPAPAPAPTPTQKRKGAWRQDPGF